MIKINMATSCSLETDLCGGYPRSVLAETPQGDHTTVKLSDGAAKALNGAFQTDALKGGTTVGVATIEAALPGHMKQMPSGGVATGGGSTDGMEHTGLIAGGSAAVLLAAAMGFVAIRRHSAARTTADTDKH
ncbi:MAG TPA: hypothetical protein VGL02_09680 [Streptomyces sp.]